MKPIYILGISTILVLSACNAKAEEQSNAGKRVESLNEVQAKDNQNNNVKGIKFGYEYNWEDVKRDLFSLESQLDKKDYGNIKTFFDTFTLPEEGRLTPEKAKEYFPQNTDSGSTYSFSDNQIYYKNYLVFDSETKKAIDTNIWGYDANTLDPIEPFKTQAIGLFMSIIEEINNEGYLSPKGEVVEKYTNLTTEEKEFLNDERFRTPKQEHSSPPKGWGALQSVSDRIQLKLEYIEPYLKEYHELYTWSKETRQYLQVANSIGYDDYEKAYQYIVAATNNIESMSEVVPKK